jgi:hypothetical protein
MRHNSAFEYVQGGKSGICGPTGHNKRNWVKIREKGVNKWGRKEFNPQKLDKSANEAFLIRPVGLQYLAPVI